MKYDLKPCPYCGGSPRVFVSTNDNMFVPIDARLGLNYHSVRCYSCNSGTALYRDLGRAIEAWNRMVQHGTGWYNMEQDGTTWNRMVQHETNDWMAQ